jgi:plasmid stabilization system protein ParE
MTDSSPASPPEAAEPAAWVRWTLRALVVLPMVVAAARAVATGWFPVGDGGLLAIRAYDVGTADHPLLGSWTSASLTLGVDINNPGALYPDLLAPFMWTLGRWVGIGAGVAIGVASVNACFALATGWVGHRIGGWRIERWALLMVAALSWSMGSELLIDIWQPHALLLPFACLLMLTTGLLAGVWRLLPVWLGVASLVVQTHIGYVYVIVVLGLLTAGSGIAALRSSSSRPADLIRHRTAAVSAVVLALAWIQPLVEQLFGAGQGNLTRLATNAGGGDTTIGAATAIKLVARVVALPPWWARSGFADSVTPTPLTETGDGPRLIMPDLPSGPLALVAVAVLVAVLAVVFRALRRDGKAAAARAALIALVGVVAAVATLTIQTVSAVGLGQHHVRWLWPLSLFVQVAIAWAVVELDVGRRLRPYATPAVGVLVAAAALLNLGVTAHDVGPTADRAAADTLEHTFDDLAEFRPGGAVRYDTHDARPFEPWSAGVIMRLRELGIAFRVDDDVLVRQLGNRRRADGTEVTTIHQIERGAAVGYDGPGCVISRASSVDAATEAAVDALITSAAADLAAGAVDLRLDGLDPELALRLRSAAAGDGAEAFVLVADGLLAFLAGTDRIATGTPAVDQAVASAAEIDRRVEGTLVLVTDPPHPCNSPAGGVERSP